MSAGLIQLANGFACARPAFHRRTISDPILSCHPNRAEFGKSGHAATEPRMCLLWIRGLCWGSVRFRMRSWYRWRPQNVTKIVVS